MIAALFFLFLLILSASAYYFAQNRAILQARKLLAKRNRRQIVSTHENRMGLQALPSFYGTRALYLVFLPIMALWVLWLIASPLIQLQLLAQASQSVLGDAEVTQSLLLQRSLIDARDTLLQTQSWPQGFEDNLKPAVMPLLRFAQFNQQGFYLLLAAIALMLALFAFLSSRPKLRARHSVERWNTAIMLICSLVAILITLGIISSLIVQAYKFFQLYNLFDFLSGLRWKPSTLDKGGAFGIIPLLLGTSLVTLIAMCVAVPVGLLSAIYLTEFASPRMRNTLKPVLEILAGIPTVVYGLFGALFFAPLLKTALEMPPLSWLIGAVYGLFGAQPEAIPIDFALAAGMVMGVMITPFVASMSDDAIKSVPNSLRDGALGLGSTHAEVVKNVLLPAALPGIAGGVLLAVSRAIGETMIMVMMLGTFAYLNVNPLKPVSTFTVQINTLFLGDNDYGSAPVLAAFAIGLFLFILTLLLNTLALYIVRRFRENYD